MLLPDWPDTGWVALDAPEGFRVARGDAGIAVLMIDRTPKKNALTLAMWSALPGLLATLANQVRALIVTGAGDVFSAGADVGELQRIYADPDRARAYHATNVAAEGALAAFPQPTIAAVRGSCVGGGCQLAVACDIRIADAEAFFGITPAKLGIIYPAEPTARLARLVGPARAKYLLYTADLISAPHALTFGLVDEVVPGSGHAGVARRAIEVARTIASRSPQSIGAATAVIDTISAGGDVAAAAEALAPWHRQPTDVTEGLAAFIERRPPSFG